MNVLDELMRFGQPPEQEEEQPPVTPGSMTAPPDAAPQQAAQPAPRTSAQGLGVEYPAAQFGDIDKLLQSSARESLDKAESYKPEMLMPTPELQEALRRNMQAKDALYEKLGFRKDPQTGNLTFVSAEEEANERMKERFGGKGGIAKRFLMETLNTLMGSKLWEPQKELARIAQHRAEAAELLRQIVGEERTGLTALSNAQNFILKQRSSEFANAAKAIAQLRGNVNSDFSARIAEAKVQLGQDKLAMQKKHQELFDEVLRQKLMRGEIPGDSGTYAEAYAVGNLLAENEEYAKIFRMFPEQIDKWPAEMQARYRELQNEGAKEFLNALLRAKTTGRAYKPNVVTIRSNQGYLDENNQTKMVEKVSIVQVDTNSGQVRVLGELAQDAANAERIGKVQSAGALINSARSAFNTMALNPTDEAAMMGAIRGTEFYKLLVDNFPKYFNMNLDEKNAPSTIRTLLASQEGRQSFIKLMFDYSGKQTNEREMRAMKNMIFNLTQSAPVFTATAAMTYYSAMAGAMQAGLYNQIPGGTVPTNKNFAPAIVVATTMALKKAETLHRSGKLSQGTDPNALLNPTEFVGLVNLIDSAIAKKENERTPQEKTVIRIIENAMRPPKGGAGRIDLSLF